jgi:hypothetical protein
LTTLADQRIIAEGREELVEARLAALELGATPRWIV